MTLGGRIKDFRSGRSTREARAIHGLAHPCCIASGPSASRRVKEVASFSWMEPPVNELRETIVQGLVAIQDDKFGPDRRSSVIGNWTFLVFRSALAVHCLVDAGFEEESMPLMRSIAEHVTSIIWVNTYQDEALRAIDEVALFNAEQLRKSAGEAGTDMSRLRPVPKLPDAELGPKKRREEAKSFTKRIESIDLKDMAVMYRLLSLASHPTKTTSMQYSGLEAMYLDRFARFVSSVQFVAAEPLKYCVWAAEGCLELPGSHSHLEKWKAEADTVVEATRHREVS